MNNPTVEGVNTGWPAEAETAEEKAVPKLPPMEDFYLPRAQNDGVKFVLIDAKGNETDHYLIVRGRWSDAYLNSQDENALLRAARDSGRNTTITESFLTARSRAALIAGWSFDEPCTKEAALNLVTRNPKLGQQIEVLAWNEERFFDK